jgi:hypothetical protein
MTGRYELGRLRRRVLAGRRTRRGAADELARLHQGTFADAEQRLARDAQIVARRLPANAEFARVQGTPGWFYSFENEFGDRYEMFIYFFGSNYQVKVIEPEVEGRYTPHDGHLYEDGRICFGTGGGMPTLESAYAKSVLWANGFSAYVAAKQAGTPIPFPFSINNS